MKKRHFPRLLSCLLAAALLFALLPRTAYADDLEDEIEELRKQRLAIAEEHDKKQQEVDELEEQKASVILRKQAMDERNEFTRKEIQSIQQEIGLYDQMIEQEAQKLEQAKAQEALQLQRYRARVRALEENGELSILALLLRVNSMSELLTAFDDAGDIMRSDKELYELYIAARENTQRVKAAYETRKKELQAKQAELQARQAELEKDIEEAHQLIRDLENEIDQGNEELHELLLAEIEAAEQIDALLEEQERLRREEEERRRQEEEARRQQEEAAANPAPSGADGGESFEATGSWGWPCPGCYYITSRAGYRYHPITGAERYHSGLDIGASYGSAVVAADGGTVIMASVNSGYGNCVIISHGNGYYTLYGHLSGYAVENGQSVGKGQTVGYVGDTGWATGPHLHFEVRQGGPSSSYAVDPEAVCGFSGLSYAPDA